MTRLNAILAPLLLLGASMGDGGLPPDGEIAQPITNTDGDVPDLSGVFLPARTGGHRGLGGPVHSPGTKARRAWKVRRQTSGRGGERR